MKPSRLGSVVQKYRSLRAMARARLDGARRALLTNIIETYLPLEADEQDELRRMIAAPEAKEIRDMISVYEQRGIEKGIEQGIARGIERGKRESMLILMRHKFGKLPDEVLKVLQVETNR